MLSKKDIVRIFTLIQFVVNTDTVPASKGVQLQNTMQDNGSSFVGR